MTPKMTLTNFMIELENIRMRTNALKEKANEYGELSATVDLIDVITALDAALRAANDLQQIARRLNFIVRFKHETI